MELKRFKYRTTEGFNLTAFGWIVRCESYRKRIPFELRSGMIKYIRIGKYFIFAVKIWKWRKLTTTQKQSSGLRIIWNQILNPKK